MIIVTWLSESVTVCLNIMTMVTEQAKRLMTATVRSILFQQMREIKQKYLSLAIQKLLPYTFLYFFDFTKTKQNRFALL